MTGLREILEGSAAEQGWSEASQIRILLDFLAHEASHDRLVRERFQDFLDRRVDAENEGEVYESYFGIKLETAPDGTSQAPAIALYGYPSTDALKDAIRRELARRAAHAATHWTSHD